MKKRAFGKLYKELFYIPKYEKLPDKVFRCRMVLSLLTILACTAVMAASTFALFFSEVSTDNSTIASAYYSVTVDKIEDDTYVCPLSYEDKHTFKIKADGNATTGYCEIQIGDETYYTKNIPQGDSIMLTVQAAKGTEIIFTPKWGVNSEEACGNKIFHSETPYVTYEVEPTAKISDIAKHYGIPRSHILIYNDISESVRSPKLTIGAKLKIPDVPEDIPQYAVPFGTYIVEPTARLDDIAEYYDLSRSDILIYNNMSEDDISSYGYSSTDFAVGCELKIPGVDEDDTPYAVPYAVYKVEPTATLYDISDHYGVSATDILLYNGIREIKVGRSLKIPGISDNVTPYAVSYTVYKVEATATLEGISEHYGISIEDIKAYNDIEEIVTDYKLKIPGVPSSAEPYVAPVPEIPKKAVYSLISEGTLKMSESDILIYEGIEYDRELDSYIAGLKAANIEDKQGEYFLELTTNTENLSLCFEITEKIARGYLKIIIGESEYFTAQLEEGSYIRLDILSEIGTEIRFEAYEGVSEASINGEMLYGDDLTNNKDGNEPILEHISDN